MSALLFELGPASAPLPSVTRSPRRRAPVAAQVSIAESLVPAALSALPARHRGELHTLVQGECVEVLDRLPPESVDLVFADPPYHLSNGGTTCSGGQRVAVDKGSWDQSRGMAWDLEFHRGWLAACRRVLKPTGTLWVSGTQHVIFRVGYLLQEAGWHLLNTVTWFKPNARPNLGCRQLTHSTELLIWAAPARTEPLAHTFNYAEMKAAAGGVQMRDLWQFNPPGRREKTHGRHPTQKPIALLERVIDATTRPGDLVVDPFNGSGTTGVVVVARGRRYLGIDLEAEYLDLTHRRLADPAAALADDTPDTEEEQ